ncbi:hypothetical protein [Niveispirillum sp.]|uniref:hypothetical protein n=1 Tax=Niveispirillum sp. TaxID=1917217 RepID=UPI001B7AC3AF|nr:hypothetical protein [Niveispirillum sp.]MBP7339430.1 hypothetical protein [Niveispirillum sp.]
MASDATPATNPSSLSVSDIDTKVNHEPRIRDLRLAEVLGMVNPHSIRRLIQRHRGVLEGFGEIISHQDAKLGAGRPSSSYYLTKRQALFLTAKADTPRAAMVTVEMVEVFDRFTSGRHGVTLPQAGMALVRLGDRTVTIDLAGPAQGGEGPWLVTPHGRTMPEIVEAVRFDVPGPVAGAGCTVIIPDVPSGRYAALWGRVVERGATRPPPTVTDSTGHAVALTEPEIMAALAFRRAVQQRADAEIARLRRDVGTALSSALDRVIIGEYQLREGIA